MESKHPIHNNWDRYNEWIIVIEMNEKFLNIELK